MSGRVLSPRPVLGFARAYFGCPACGTVFTLPADPNEPAPWCLHGGSEGYSWHAPGDPESDWARMKRVEVRLLEALESGEWKAVGRDG